MLWVNYFGWFCFGCIGFGVVLFCSFEFVELDCCLFVGFNCGLFCF